MRREKGITLIALIITIIVMLILVGVVVQVVIQSDLLGTAKTAGDKYKTAYEEESNMSQIEINGKKYDSIEDYLAGVESIPEIHNWVRTGDTLKCAHCNTTLTIGQQLDYRKTGTGSSNISEEKSGIAQAKADGQSWATNYGVQTVNIASDDTKWVVLGAESSNGNDGTNETLLLTTETPTTGKIRMYGYQTYNHAVDEINRMCKEIYGTDARGMTIEDVNNCFNYTPPAGICVKIDSNGNQKFYNVPANTKISDLGSSYENIWTDIQNNATVIDGTKKYFTPSCPEGTTDSSVLGNIPVDGYAYFLSNDATYLVEPANNTDTSHTITIATKNLIFGESKEYRYWLASRGVVAGSVCACFGPGTVDEGFARSFGGLFGSRGTSGDYDFSLRAVVSLRSDIPAVVE